MLGYRRLIPKICGYHLDNTWDIYIYRWDTHLKDTPGISLEYRLTHWDIFTMELTKKDGVYDHSTNQHWISCGYTRDIIEV